MCQDDVDVVGEEGRRRRKRGGGGGRGEEEKGRRQTPWKQLQKTARIEPLSLGKGSVRSIITVLYL